MTSPHVPKLRVMTRGILLTLIGWLTLLVLGLWLDARWPETYERWHTLIVAMVAIEFLTLKAWLMARRAWTFDRLTAALVAANAMFAVTYLWLFVILALWPGIKLIDWDRTLTARLLDVLALILIWGFVEMLLIPDPPDATDERR